MFNHGLLNNPLVLTEVIQHAVYHVLQITVAEYTPHAKQLKPNDPIITLYDVSIQQRSNPE